LPAASRVRTLLPARIRAAISPRQRFNVAIFDRRELRFSWSMSVGRSVRAVAIDPP
jgi:hypothetical protein